MAKFKVGDGVVVSDYKKLKEITKWSDESLPLTGKTYTVRVIGKYSFIGQQEAIPTISLDYTNCGWLPEECFELYIGLYIGEIAYDDLKEGTIYRFESGASYIVKWKTDGYLFPLGTWDGNHDYHDFWKQSRAYLATAEEIEHYEACKAANKFIPLGEVKGKHKSIVTTVTAGGPNHGKIEVFPGIHVGDVVVSLNKIHGRRDVGDIYEVLTKSSSKRLYYKYNNNSACKDEWRKATKEEEGAYRQGIRNIKDVKFCPPSPYLEPLDSIKEPEYVKCIGEATDLTIGKIYNWPSPIDDEGTRRIGMYNLENWNDLFEPSTIEAFGKQCIPTADGASYIIPEVVSVSVRGEKVWSPEIANEMTPVIFEKKNKKHSLITTEI